MTVALFIAIVVAFGSAASPAMVSHFYQATPTGARINGFTFFVPLSAPGVGNLVVCMLNIRYKRFICMRNI
jgi:hypothetical protein